MTIERLGKSLSVAFSNDGELLATLTERSVRILSAADRSKLLTLKLRNASDVRFSPSGNAFLVKTTSGQISWHAIDGGHSEVIRPDQGEGPAPEFASSTQVVNAGWNGVVELINLASAGSVNARRFEGEAITAIHRLADGKIWLLRHSPKATAEDLPPEPCYFTSWSGEVLSGTPCFLRHELRFIRASALHPSGRVLAVVSGAPPNQLAVVDANTSTIHKTLVIEPSGTGSQVAWSPDGQCLAVVENHTVRVYDQQLVLLREFPVLYACSVGFAPDGRALAVGSWQDGSILELSAKT
jgi:WD40 repeat protein